MRHFASEMSILDTLASNSSIKIDITIDKLHKLFSTKIVPLKWRVKHFANEMPILDTLASYSSIKIDITNF